jgi:hypothetical protein
LSNDGSVLAVGRPYPGDDNEGATVVYKIPSSCENDKVPLRFSLTSSIAVIFWWIENSFNDVLLFGGPYRGNGEAGPNLMLFTTKFVHEGCIPKG